MQATANLRPFDGLEFEQHRRAKHHATMPARRVALPPDRAAEPHIPLWQTCLLAAGSSLLLWGVIGAAAWRLLG